MDITTLCTTAKMYHDMIHGYIGISMFSLQIINTAIFQRLASLKQLGPCRYIYSNAVHTRYEHSIGTYYLAGEVMTTIATLDNQSEINLYLKEIPELKSYYEKYNIITNLLTPYVRELVKIAGLCHDIGHGPFSHLFDDVFLGLTKEADNPNRSHEVRSNLLIEMVIKQNPNLRCVSSDEIEFIKSLINPNEDQRGFIYQIISNDLNGLDVDKFDYLQRDIKMVDFQAKLDITRLVKHIKIINNMIVYPFDSADDIENLFRTRYRMYRNIYNHENVTAVQSIIIDIMLELDKIMNLSGSINNMETFITLNDNTILECVNVIEKLHWDIKNTNEQTNIQNTVSSLLNKLYVGDFHLALHTIVSSTKIDAQGILKMTGLDDDILKNVIFTQVKAGFLSGNKPNPFDTIYFYNYREPTKIIGNIESLSKSKPVLSSTSTHQEYVTTYFYTGHNASTVDILRQALGST